MKSQKRKMTGVIRCLLIIVLCAQLLMATSFATEIKLSNLDDHVVAINPIGEDGSKERMDHEVKDDEVVVSKKSSAKKGSGGGNNVVRDPAGKKKNDAMSRMPRTMSFYVSVCLFLALSF